MFTKALYRAAFWTALLTGLFCLAIALPAAPAAAAPDTPNAGATALETAAPQQVAAAKPGKPTKAQLKSFKKASADFSLELFQRCVASKGKNANVTVAPMSVMFALATTANGANGKTSAQMRKVLGDGASMARINANLRWYESRLVSTKRAKLSNANGIWYDTDGGLRVNKGFLRKAKAFYHAQVTGASFADPATTDEVNAWVKDKTNGMIPKIVNRLSPDDRIAIVNALYFDAKWKEPFQKEATRTQTFKDAAGKKHKVKMMHGTEHTYLSGAGAVGFMKPYAKGYSYVALLPKKGTSLKAFVKKLDGDAFRSLIAKRTSAIVHVSMPKYSVTYSNGAMEKQLSAMGVKAAFSANADFSKMGSVPSGKLSIGSVAHKTRVDVDETGTKAAAATAVMLKANATLDVDVKTVTLNRPFVYAIVDNTTKLPVFIGTVNKVGK